MNFGRNNKKLKTIQHVTLYRTIEIEDECLGTIFQFNLPDECLKIITRYRKRIRRGKNIGLVRNVNGHAEIYHIFFFTEFCIFKNISLSGEIDFFKASILLYSVIFLFITKIVSSNGYVVHTWFVNIDMYTYTADRK